MLDSRVSSDNRSEELRPRAQAGRKGLVLFLLTLIVLLGAYFRFDGQNWDDFAGLHPDERFLTRNLLPLIGGGLEFTPTSQYPPHAILVPSLDNGGANTFDIRSRGRIGALSGTLAADVADWWVGPERARTYAAPNIMIDAMLNNDIDAILIDETAATLLLDSAFLLDTIGSEEIQRQRCLSLYPQQGGAGPFFDTSCSPFNPHNAGAGFYAYGTLPLLLAHFGSEFVQTQDAMGVAPFNFQGGVLIWRFFSAFFDIGTIILIFFIGARMHNPWVGLMAALMYAAAPLAIQKAHFGTVNAVTNFFVTLGLYMAVSVQLRSRLIYYAFFGVALGASVAGRINTAPLVGLIILASMVQAAPIFDDRVPWSERRRIFLHEFGGLVLAAFISILTFRIANPYTFTGPGFFGLGINERFLADLASGTFGISGASDGPPNWQWLGRPSYIYPLKDMLFWGMGIAMGVLAWLGWAWSGYRILRGRKGALINLLVFVWVLVYFAWMGRQWVMTMRYYLPLYGALALLAAWALHECWRVARARDLPLTRFILLGFGLLLMGVPIFEMAHDLSLTFTSYTAGLLGLGLLLVGLLPRLRLLRPVVLITFVLGFTVLWGLMFTSIYRTQSTRLEASRWLWERIPGDFAMQIEGASPETPLINLALRNQRPESSTNTQALFSSATRLLPGAPLFTEFVAPASGQVSSIYTPHLGDPNDSGDPATISISVSALGEDLEPELLAIATLQDNFARTDHVLGNAYEIPFDVPLEVLAGQRYSVKVEALDRELMTGGSVVVTEGDWDDRLTTIKICSWPAELSLADNIPPGFRGYDECNGLDSYFGLVHSYDMALSYPVDEALKLDNMIEGLHNGEYLAITSNRFYDGVSRNPMRWPMTTAYYEMLFAGELGYELIQTFDQPFELGPLRVSDQHLPTYDSPAWLNELESDEAFHVYDHPVVFIFQKTPNYDAARVDFLLSSIPMDRNVETGNPDREIGEQILGVIYWPSLQADESPTALIQPVDKLALNQAGGTWSERFDSNSLLISNEALGVGVWYALLIVYGLFAWPILFVVMPGLVDRGYGFAKLLGLLLVAYVTWLASSGNIPLWNQGGVLLTLLTMAVISMGLIWTRRAEFGAYVRAHWRRLFAIEMITLLLFLAFIALRLSNPDLWHYAKGGEKPMDFAYFNGVLRSTVFPPVDPWYAEGYINYYYWGYVLVGSPVLLLKLVPAFAYNLIIPSIAAMAGIGAFSAAYNIVARLNERRLNSARSTRGNPWIAGIAALLLCVVLGNLDTIRVLGIGVAQLGGYRTPVGLENYLMQQYIAENGTMPDPNSDVYYEITQRAREGHLLDNIAYEMHNSVSLVTGFAEGLGRALSGSPLPIGTDRWYWGPSRVLAETPGVEGGAITEMPFFTFTYGDLHAHMINLPVLLFVIGFLFNEITLAHEDRRKSWQIALAISLGAMAVGMMQAINTWDWPAFLLLCVLGLGYAAWQRWQRLDRWFVLYTLATVGGFVALNFAFAQPYTTWYASTYSSIRLWDGGKSPLWAYFDIHGLFLFLVTALLIWETARWMRSVTAKSLRGRANRLMLVLFVAFFVLCLSFILALLGYQVALIALPLIVWVGLLFFRPGQTLEMQFVLVLIGLALSMTLGVEIIVLGGDIGRQNTVFKFYMQVWILFSVAGGAAFAWLFQHSDDWTNRARSLWFIPLTILFLIAAMFPVMASRGRSYDRMAANPPLTLDGLAYMNQSELRLGDVAETIDLREDYAIIRWLQENVIGTPTIMEGRNSFSEYQWNGRIAINTGLPAVLGWNFHQRQQRTLDPLPSFVEARERNINYFYNTRNIAGAARILRHYDVHYVIVSSLELVRYLPDGLDKLRIMADEGLLEIVFETGPAKIYAVNHDMLETYLFEQAQSERSGR